MANVIYLTKDQIIAGVTTIEAGYVNNPNDSGGETNHGITKAVANAHKSNLVKLYNWDGKMINLSKPMATYIYDVDYWKKLRLDDIYKISPILADKLFDIGVNCGISLAGLWLQDILNVSNNRGTHYEDLVADGILGSATLRALNGLIAKRGMYLAMKVLIKSLLACQTTHYIDQCKKYEKNETFFIGWSNRTDHNVDVYLDYLKTLK